MIRNFNMLAFHRIIGRGLGKHLCTGAGLQRGAAGG
jgi:hypothetical protein